MYRNILCNVTPKMIMHLRAYSEASFWPDLGPVSYRCTLTSHCISRVHVAVPTERVDRQYVLRLRQEQTASTDRGGYVWVIHCGYPYTVYDDSQWILFTRWVYRRHSPHDRLTEAEPSPPPHRRCCRNGLRLRRPARPRRPAPTRPSHTPAIHEGCTRSLRISYSSRRAPLQPVIFITGSLHSLSPARYPRCEGCAN
jgi:hypothetical protein